MYRNERRTRSSNREKSKRTTINWLETKTTWKLNSEQCNSSSNQDEATSQRDTMPLQVLSQAVRKAAKGCIFKEQSCHFSNEDLHTILETVSGNSPELTQTYPFTSIRARYENVTNYYDKLEYQQASSQTNQQCNYANENTSGNSIFKEINCLFQETVNKGTKNNATLSRWSVDSQLNNNLMVNQKCFCNKLKEQLSLVTLSSRETQCIKRIAVLVAEINKALEGEEDISSVEVVLKNTTKNKRRVNKSSPVSQLIPKTGWLYKTPRSQKLCRPIITSGATELKPCILQRGITSKFVFELGTSPTNFNFVDTSYDTLSSYDMGNKLPKESFKILPPAVNQNTHTGRNAMSVFGNAAVPIFQDVKEPFKSNRNLAIPHRPNKVPANITRDNLGPPRCLLFRKPTKRQKTIFNNQSTECVEDSKRNKLPAHSLFQRNHASFNKENVRPQDLSNHPKGAEFSINETFTINNSFLFPPIPDFGDPLPLPFYPRKIFDTE